MLYGIDPGGHTWLGAAEPICSIHSGVDTGSFSNHAFWSAPPTSGRLE
jgi:hypothetical protein